MAVHIDGLFDKNLVNLIKSSKILVVGAGGIGCELLKNLVLTGFEDVEVIDLDIIDVSNLNRQFLFHKQHVGKSKSQVAKESALLFNPKAKIIAYHDSIISPDYGVNFYKKFSLVMNALDNRTARNHVNRMCLAADICLIESGTSGYLGQVTVIKKGMTECYECQPKATQKSFPGCTIRNTPSEPIHCIVWAKHLFNQLFGEADADEDVSPDSADPEQVGEAAKSVLDSEANDKGNVTRVSTRAWAASHNYNSEKIFHKLFHDDIEYLLSMDKLWQKRRPPTPLIWNDLRNDVECLSSEGLIKDQRPWSLFECRDIFGSSIESLKIRLQALKENDHLVWDKDDENSLDFVTSCANIRAAIFGITQKTRFDVKSMAGNIIPAIATTNAVIAGLIVLEGIKILQKNFKQCRTIYLNRKPNPRRRLLVPCLLDAANPHCYVCSPKPEVCVRLDAKTMSVKLLQEKVLKSALNMVAPDVEIMDGKGTILISSEPGETEDNDEKMLDEFGITDGTRLNCDDFLQNYNLVVNVVQSEESTEEFEVIGDPDKLKEQQQEQANSKLEENKDTKETNGTENVPGCSRDDIATVEDDDCIVCLDEEEMETQKEEVSKRKAEDDEASSSKRRKIEDEIVIN